MSILSSVAVAQLPPAAPASTAGNAAAGAPQEKDLDAPGTITLVPGDHFRIAVPLRLEAPLNLGAAQLDITLSRHTKAKKAEVELHLIAVLGTAQASLKAGDKSVILHGVAAELDGERTGDYHPSDYSIHLGSGNITNLGTPDERFIDTEALTNKLQDLHVHLKATAAR